MEADLNSTIASKIGESAAEQWRLLMRHLSWCSGFSLVLVSIPDSEAAAVCRKELESELKKSRQLLVKQVDQSVFIYQLPEQLAKLQLPRDTSVVWVEIELPANAGMGLSAEQHAENSRKAWRHVAARLNERRELLQNQIPNTLIFVGPPEVSTIIRDHAPDLWSVRALMLELERTQPRTPQPRHKISEAEGEWRSFFISDAAGKRLRQLLDELGCIPMLPTSMSTLCGHDPELNRIEASRWGQRHGIEAKQAEIEALVRAAFGFLGRHELAEAERTARDAWGRIQSPNLAGSDAIWRAQKNIESLTAVAWAQLLSGDAAGSLQSAHLAVSTGRDGPAGLLREPAARQAMYAAFGAMGQAAQKLDINSDHNKADAGLSEFADASGESPELLALHALWRAQRLLLNGKGADLENAEKALREALRNDALPLGPRARALFWFAACLLSRDHTEEAERATRRGLLLLEAAWPRGVDPEEAPFQIAILVELARALVRAKHGLAAAEAALHGALSLLDRRGAPDKELIEPTMLLGMVLTLKGQYAAAELELRRAFDLQRAHKLPMATRRETTQALVSALFLQSRWDDAENLLRETCNDFRQAGEADSAARLERILRFIGRLRPRWLFASLFGAVGRLNGWRFRRRLMGHRRRDV